MRDDVASWGVFVKGLIVESRKGRDPLISLGMTLILINCLSVEGIQVPILYLVLKHIYLLHAKSLTNSRRFFRGETLPGDRDQK